MKRLLLILCVLGFANLSQGQTKEEALEWLKNNITLAYSPHITKAISPRAREDNSKPSQMVFVDENSIRIIDQWQDITVPFTEFLYEEDVDQLEKEYLKDSSFYSFGGAFWFIIKLSKGERRIGYYTTPEKEADVKRVLKAIMHIAKLNGAKENKQIF